MGSGTGRAGSGTAWRRASRRRCAKGSPATGRLPRFAMRQGEDQRAPLCLARSPPARQYRLWQPSCLQLRCVLACLLHLHPGDGDRDLASRRGGHACPPPDGVACGRAGPRALRLNAPERSTGAYRADRSHGANRTRADPACFSFRPRRQLPWHACGNFPGGRLNLFSIARFKTLLVKSWPQARTGKRAPAGPLPPCPEQSACTARAECAFGERRWKSSSP